ncbi:MAG: prepilin-type N-terminal cleavage/methylation domain-containing protein [Opitutaceae bacterium]
MSSVEQSTQRVEGNKSSSSPRARGRDCYRGFTLVEVMIAATVLVLGIVSSITALQSGLQAIDNARNYTAAAQLLQNEMERLRLKSWAQLQTLSESGDTAVQVPASLKSGGIPFSCTRQITDLKTDMKQIALVASWRGYDGRTHSAKLLTRYGKTGLYDYFYTSH